MIPQIEVNLNQGIKIKKKPSRTYQLNMKTERVAGYVDGIESVKQAIYKILNTERYRYVIYSWNYGVELDGLFGKTKAFVYPELKRRIAEALLQDDRVTNVFGFEFEDGKERNTVLVIFTVSTIYGDIEVKREVNM